MAILVIEDDTGICNFLKMSLEHDGYQLDFASTGIEGISAYYRTSPDIILLDLGLGDIDGMDVIDQIRRLDQTTPIIVISARDTDSDKVAALDGGANDYLTKPFSIDELKARVRVALRLAAAQAPQPASTVFEGDTFTVDRTARQVTVDGSPIHITKREYALLEVLIDNADLVMTHQILQDRVWGYADDSTAISLRVYVRNLRKKLKTSLISTEVGVGYRLSTPSASSQASQSQIA